MLARLAVQDMPEQRYNDGDVQLCPLWQLAWGSHLKMPVYMEMPSSAPDRWRRSWKPGMRSRLHTTCQQLWRKSPIGHTKSAMLEQQSCIGRILTGRHSSRA